MNIKIFCRCSLFPSWSGQELVSTTVEYRKTQSPLGCGAKRKISVVARDQTHFIRPLTK